MRGAAVVFAVAAPVTLLVVTAAAADGPRVGPPPPGARVAPLAAVQASATRKEVAGAVATSHRGTRLRAHDAATPPSPETAPAMSAGLPLAAAPGGPREAAITLPGARAPPAAGRAVAQFWTA
ncbi:MAG TPA: hypothetical protein VFZ86_13515 [Thermoleophilia bacterium]|nr:hypothetical protein [Thermoleophilia bacterium]